MIEISRSYKNAVLFAALTIAATGAIAAPAMADPGMPDASGMQLLAQEPSGGASNDLCRKVDNPPEGLNIRAKATATSAIVGGVGKGETLTLTTSPATTQKEGNRTWIQVSAPAAGWVSNGVMSPGHLVMCGNTAPPTKPPEPKPNPPSGSRCRRVISPPEGLVIKSQAARSSTTVGGLALGEKMTLTSDPASSKKDGEGRTWLQIEAPKAGWVSNGFGGQGNVGKCP